jgi:hypothetical protein
VFNFKLLPEGITPPSELCQPTQSWGAITEASQGRVGFFPLFLLLWEGMNKERWKNKKREEEGRWREDKRRRKEKRKKMKV